MDLRQIRAEIDSIDEQLLLLLNRRMEFTLRTRKLKSSVEEPKREQEIISRIRSRFTQLISPEFSERLFLEIFAESKRLQSESRLLVGFQCEHGAFSEIAVKHAFPDAIAIPHVDFHGVFEGVKSGVLDYGVVPVENSVAGNVTEVDDLLIHSDLFIVSEVHSPIEHCLMALPGVDHREIRVVYSHPQAIAQCRAFLTRNRLEARPYFNTAGAALMLAREQPLGAAVIASKLSAELYGLEILKESVQDSAENQTRFLVLGNSPSTALGTKCSLVLTTNHKPGALYQLLQVFSETGINLTRIESRPHKSDNARFAFLLDFEGGEHEKKVASALEMLMSEGAEVRLLGSYRELASD